jgi:hypothetical protein
MLYDNYSIDNEIPAESSTVETNLIKVFDINKNKNKKL